MTMRTEHSGRKTANAERIRRIRVSAVLAGAKTSQLAPILVAGVSYLKTEGIPFERLSSLQIDEAYQRWQISTRVNLLIAVMERGGFVPPIDVAERPDGQRYIVDGQQRWWAAWHTKQGIRAHIYASDGQSSEKQLFVARNAVTRVNSNVIVKAWTGESGQLFQWLAEDEGSPIQGLLNFKTGKQSTFAAGIVARGIEAAINGAWNQGSLEYVMRRLDSEIRRCPARTQRLAANFAAVLREVLSGRVKIARVVALGLACYHHWADKETLETPSRRIIDLLRRMNWDRYAPNNRTEFIPFLKSEILKRWPA